MLLITFDQNIIRMGVFSANDYIYAAKLGIDQESLDSQWRRINEGFRSVVLDRPALLNDGILRISEEEEKELIQLYNSEKESYSILKFIPASGAASRMFEPIREMRDNPDNASSREILASIDKFPFYSKIIEKAIEKNENVDSLLSDAKKLANFILHDEGLNYNIYPKGLIPFHENEGNISTAFEQQVSEADELCDRTIHFTVDDAFLREIHDFLEEKKASYSIQEPSTHFISKHNDSPVRNTKGELLFRPSGHGALLENLNSMDADIVFIKNIDNIQIPEKNKASVDAKKVLGGFLFQLKIQIDTFLWQLEEDKEVDTAAIAKWIQQNLNKDFSYESKKNIFDYLNRPIRIAGMVLNEGKVGGGPFWVKKNNTVSLQIVEGAQIVKEDKSQNEILNSSTHFNPVDLACSLKNYRGEKFDLKKYIDEESGFLSSKVVEGKNATIIERPGLWNGSMANWISVFIELPIESFTPVKSILDLLECDYQ